MSNREQLKNLLLDVFLLDSTEFRFDLARDEVDTWDSLGIVALAVGVQEVFGYHMAQEEAIGITSIGDLIQLLERKGIPFDD